MKKNGYSLFECFVALTLLALLTTTLSIPTKRYYRNHKEKKAVEAFITWMQNAHDWVLFTESDLQIKLSYHNQYLSAEMNSANEKLNALLPEKTNFFFPNHLLIKDPERSTPIQLIAEPFEFTLSYYGGVQAPFYLSFSKTSKQKEVYIPGYPYVF